MQKIIALLLLVVCGAAMAELPDPRWVVGDSIGQAYILLPETVAGTNPVTIQFHFFTDLRAQPKVFLISVVGCAEGKGTATFTTSDGKTLVKSDNWESNGEQVLDALAEGACRAAQERIS